MDHRNPEKPSRSRQPPSPPSESGKASQGSDANAPGLFSITCTTCQARLVVRSASAIGTIVECPRCASMVQVTPPPGWTPASSASTAPPSGGPPPLNHVAAEPVGLELEPPAPSRWFWPVVWAVVLLTTLGVALLLLQWAPAKSSPGPTAAPEQTASEKPPVETPVPSEASKSRGLKKTAEKAPEKAPPEETKPKPEPTTKIKSPAASAPKATSQETPTKVQNEAPKKAPPSQKAAEQLPATPSVTKEKPPAVKKKPPEPIDFAARLNDPLAHVQWNRVPLRQAVDWLSALGAMPISIDLDALQSLGVGLNDPVSLDLPSTTLGKALEAIASQRGLAVAAESDRVVLGDASDDRNAMRTVRYDVSDLTDNDPAAASQLVEWVQRLVAPDSWQSTGGHGAIAVEPGRLAITQTGENQRCAMAFCERLRLARRKPLHSDSSNGRFTLTTRRDQAQAILSGSLTGNFHEPAPLAKVLDYLARTAPCTILVDHAALAAADTSDSVPCSLVFQKQPLGQVLDQLLPPLGLVYRAFGSKTLQITTREAAEQRLELEFYPIAAWLDAGATADDVLHRVKTGVAAATWIDEGGSADVCFDPASKCLIVLQSQPVQVEIERFLKSPPKKIEK